MNVDTRITNNNGKLPIDCHRGKRDPTIFNELVKEDDEIYMSYFLQIVLHIMTYSKVITNEELKQMLFTICERLPVTHTINVECLQYDTVVTCIDGTRNSFGQMTYWGDEFLDVYSRILFELPVRIGNVPAGLSSNIDQLRKDYVADGPVWPLSHICRQVIRKHLHPVRGHKIEKLNLPYCLAQFCRQTDVAERIHEQILDFY